MVEKVRVPGPQAGELARRRKEVLDAMGDGAAMLLCAGNAPVYSNDTEYRFRSNSDFAYLTGYPEEEAVLFLRRDAGAPYTLFVRPRNEEAEIWTGRRFGPQGARNEFGADAAWEIGELNERLPDLLDGVRTLYIDPWAEPAIDAAVNSALGALRGKERFGRIAADRLIRPAELLHEMRLHKSEGEVSLMQRAAAISVDGHLAGLRACRPGMMEYELQAAIEDVFRRQGAAGPGYPSIVGAGENGCILHYIENDRRIEDGDLVLVDAGAEYGGYNGDITRTFPASGQFTAAQRDLYEIVLDALERGIAMTRPGETIDGIHEMTLRRLTEGMLQLGLLEGSLDENMERESYKKYYMHRTSHWLGMDVHDVGRYRVDDACRPLRTGMIFTIEPGIYIQPGDESAPAELRGQAVRIEDDVLVTAEGCRNLTRGVPVAADEIEALVGSGSS